MDGLKRTKGHYWTHAANHVSHVSYIKSQSGGNSGQLVFKMGNLPILNTEPTVCHSVSFLFAETASGATVYKTIDVKPKALENNTQSG